MKRMMQFAMMVAVVLIVIVSASRVSAQGTFYAEETKDGRIYVFYNISRYGDWKQGGEMGVAITRIGYGPNGETVVFDSNEAVNMYNYKHNLPIEKFPAPPAPPAPQEKLPYRFSGLMFGDYFYNVQRDPDVGILSNIATPGPEDFNAFQFRRIYFTFDDDLSPSFTTRFRLEADQVSLTSDLKTTVFVKDAYLRWKNAFSMSDFWFGVQPTPAYDISEAAWAYRSLEKTIMDLRGVVPSRDFGVTLRGKLDGAGKYNYWVMVGNNSGNRPELDKFKRVYFNFWWKPTAKFQATGYYDYRGAAEIPDPNDPARTIGNAAGTYAVFANYANPDKYSLGFEAFWQRVDNGTKVGTGAPFVLRPRNGEGYSAWAWYNFNTRFSVVGRYDYFDPNKDKAAEGDARGLWIASFVIKPLKNVMIMPNLIAETYQDSPSGKSYKSSIVPRLTFYWVFP